jgi:hypothetical protein
MVRFHPRLIDELRDYDRTKLFADTSAGLTVAAVALPLAMAFAIASGLQPEAGLFTAIVAGFIISALGGSRVQIGGNRIDDRIRDGTGHEIHVGGRNSELCRELVDGAFMQCLDVLVPIEHSRRDFHRGRQAEPLGSGIRVHGAQRRAACLGDRAPRAEHRSIEPIGLVMPVQRVDGGQDGSVPAERRALDQEQRALGSPHELPIRIR